MEVLILIAGLVIVAAILLIMIAVQRLARAQQMLYQAKQQSEVSKKDIESERREAMLKLKDELYRRRSEVEQELHRERFEFDKLQKKINVRVETLDKREQRIEEIQRELQQKERGLLRLSDQLLANEQRLKVLSEDLTAKLENICCMTREAARAELLRSLEDEVYMSRAKWIQKEEEEASRTAKDRSIQIVVNAMQRYAADQVAPHSSGLVHLPNDDMKGRIIGKEGRNIKALEMATGMEFVIGDTPEVITIAGFNPIRREIARRSLEKLIIDGRINPTRIEEVVAQCEKEMDETVIEYGRKAVMDFNLQGVHNDLIELLGKLYFRTSFSQNALEHSIEVAYFARLLAEELGLPHPEIALRGGLFHDIGKAMSAECEGPHAVIGGEIAKRCGEDPLVVNAIAAHHNEVAFISVYSPLIIIADTISASRPGARRETLSTYLKRLEQLEEIAIGFTGVKKAYALQAGREIRVIVEEDQLTDERSSLLARDIARKIEQSMSFPGQIKVNVIREKRAIEFAR